MTRIVLFENIHPSAKEIFTSAGLDEVVTHASALQPDALSEALRGAHLIGIRSRTHLDAALLAGAPDSQAIGCFCIGTNQVDLDAAMLRGIPVFNAPFSNTRSVPSWCWARPSCCCAAFQRRTTGCIRVIGTSPPTAPSRRAARRWELSATATSVRRSAPWQKPPACVLFSTTSRLSCRWAMRGPVQLGRASWRERVCPYV